MNKKERKGKGEESKCKGQSGCKRKQLAGLRWRHCEIERKWLWWMAKLLLSPQLTMIHFMQFYAFAINHQPLYAFFPISLFFVCFLAHGFVLLCNLSFNSPFKLDILSFIHNLTSPSHLSIRFSLFCCGGLN